MQTNLKLVACLGTDDSVNSCDCCGRVDLKATVAFETESGDVVHFGFVCAARAAGTSTASIRGQVREADNAKAKAAREKSHKDQVEHIARWTSYLIEKTGGIYVCGTPDIFQMVQALGGFAKARDGFQD